MIDHYEYLSKNKGSAVPDSQEKYAKLPHFDLNEFKNLNVPGEIKELFNIMNK